MGLNAVPAVAFLLALQLPSGVSAQETDEGKSASAVLDIVVIAGLAGGLLILLGMLLKYVSRQDEKVQAEISDMRSRIIDKPGAFRAVNHYNWDYVMVFGIRYEDDHQFSAYQKKFSVKEILNRLAAGGMETRMYYSVQRDEVYCKIRCPLDRLEREADRIDYKLLFDSNALRSTCLHGRPGKWSSISIQDEHNVSPLEPYEYIYAPYEYNSKELEHMYTLYGSSVDKIPFRGVDRLKLMYNIMVSKRGDGGCNLDVVRLLKEKCMLAFYPLHDKEEKRSLLHKWLKYYQLPWNQPIDEVKDYFGEKIGLYFLWLGHYTTWLLPASVCGILAWIDVALNGNDPNVPGTAIFAVFVGLWTTMFTEFWKRKQARYAMMWGMTGFEEEEQTRPQFKGLRSTSAVDGRPVDFFPKKEANKRLVMSSLIIGFLICIVVLAVAAIFILKNWMTAQGDTFLVLGIDFASIVPSLVNAIQIQIMNMIYGSIAIRLNDLENHRTDTAYEDNLIAKTFMFQFVNSYASLVYIAFVKPLRQESCIRSCMSELSTNLGTIFLTRLAMGNVVEVVVPLVKGRAKERAERAGADPERGMSVAEREFILETYDVMLGPFEDYAEMVIQFGYSTLFVAAYPLSCFMAFLNNYIEMRVDAWKLLTICRRPEPRGAEDIGTWHLILEIISVVAVISNSALIAFTSDLFADKSPSTRLWIFFGFEHGIWLFKFALSLAIKDIPEDVEIQLQRTEYIVSKVVHNKPDDDDDELVKDVSQLSDLTIRQTDDDP
jgi:hypothetical protein